MNEPARRRFFLDEAHGGPPRLAADEQRHAAGVLRLGRGERILGLDGAGRCVPLRVTRTERDRIEVEADGDPWVEARSGEDGAALDWIEVACPLPKGERAEFMLDALTQLGLAAFQPLRAERNQGFARESAEHRAPRLLRALREALKQSRGAWLPALRPSMSVAEFAASAAADPKARLWLLEPGATVTLWGRFAAAAAAPAAEAGALPVREIVIAGPEGGFTPEERAALGRAIPVALGPNVLRIETAALAAVASLAQASYARRGRSDQAPRPRSETNSPPATTK